MQPSDCTPRDWPLYYNGTWMTHVDEGIVQVNVDGGLYIKGRNGRFKREREPSKLFPLWLRPGAYNIGNDSAVYIARKARRSARRSMACEHYYVKWMPNQRARQPNATAKQLWAGLCPLEYPDFPAALEDVEKGRVTARAVARDMILATTRNPGHVLILLRGQQAGFIRQGLFEASDEYGPLAKMVRGRLLLEGVAC